MRETLQDRILKECWLWTTTYEEFLKHIAIQCALGWWPKVTFGSRAKWTWSHFESLTKIDVKWHGSISIDCQIEEGLNRILLNLSRAHVVSIFRLDESTFVHENDVIMCKLRNDTRCSSCDMQYMYVLHTCKNNGPPDEVCWAESLQAYTTP